MKRPKKRRMQKRPVPLPVHPGRYVAMTMEHEVVDIAQAARILKIPRRHLQEIIDGKRSFTPELCHKLGGFHNSRPEHWMALQAEYDLLVVAAGEAESAYELRATCARLKELNARRGSDGMATAPPELPELTLFKKGFMDSLDTAILHERRKRLGVIRPRP